MFDNSTCDVGTQTIDKNYKKSVLSNAPEQRGTDCNLHRQCKRGKKSSFRLFIVQDDPRSNNFQDQGIRFSLEERRPWNNGQSLCFSVVSNESDEGRTIETLHHSKIENSKRSRNKFKQNEVSKHNISGSMSSLQFDRNNSEGTIDHQLINSSNPSILAWLRLKNFEEREKRRLKKQEKRELKRHAYEEAERRQKRIEESEKYFAQWLASKKKETRRAWREKRARRKVDTVENKDMIKRHNECAPPNYTAIPTFKGVQAWSEGEEISFDFDKTSSKNKTNKNSRNGIVAGKVLQTQNETTEQSALLQTHLNADTQQIFTERNMADNNTSEQVKLDKEKRKNCIERPATAEHRFVGSGKSKLSGRNKEEDGTIIRPSTSGGSMDTKFDKEVSKGRTFEEWMAHKKKKGISKTTPKNESHLNVEDGKKSTTNKSITFEAWKEQKRQERKQKVKQKKQEVVDGLLADAVIKMARKRVENSRCEKRQLDTGMPKWRFRNRVKSCSKEKNVHVHNTPASKYSLIQFFVNGHANCKTPQTGAQREAETTEAIKKSCENLRL